MLNLESHIHTSKGKSPIKVILGLAFVALLIFVLSTLVWTKYYGFTERDTPSLIRIAEKSSLQFPVTTRLLHSKLIGWQGSELFAVLEIPEQDAGYFLSTLKKKADVSDKDRFGISDRTNRDQDRWWKPDSVRKAVSYRLDLPVVDYWHRELKVLVDNDHKGFIVIYLYLRET